MCEICSKLTIKTPERRQWRRSGVFVEKGFMHRKNRKMEVGESFSYASSEMRTIYVSLFQVFFIFLIIGEKGFLK